MSTVAFAVGYANASAFTSAFTRHFGTPPKRRAVALGVGQVTALEEGRTEAP